MDVSTKVLAVDNSAAIRSIAKIALKQMGFKDIIEAEDGTLALETLKEEKVGLILAAWNMADMNGLQLVNAVRSDESLKDSPFIMVTAEGQKRGILEAAKAGVNDYIIKPFTPETLKEKIKKVLG